MARHFTTVRPAQLRHGLGTRVRVVAAGAFLNHGAEVAGYTTSKAPQYRLCFLDHPWQAKWPLARWSFAECELVEEPAP